MCRGQGRSKLILFGEHAAVYGYPAVGLSLPQAFELVCCSSSGSVRRAEAEGFRQPGGEDRQILDLLLDDLVQLGELPPQGVWMARGYLPRCGGFGSSAAVCSALASLIRKTESGRYSPETHLLANKLERRFHGSPSGIDTGMALSSGCTLWEDSGGPIPRRSLLSLSEWHLIYGGVLRHGDTASAVASVRQSVLDGDKDRIGHLKALGEIARRFTRLNYPASSEEETEAAQTEIWNSGSFPEIAGLLANEAQTYLSALGLSSPELDTIFVEARNAGALGGKLSGGGTGGAFWLCFGNKDVRDEAMRTLPDRLQSRGVSLAAELKSLSLPDY